MAQIFKCWVRVMIYYKKGSWLNWKKAPFSTNWFKCWQMSHFWKHKTVVHALNDSWDLSPQMGSPLVHLCDHTKRARSTIFSIFLVSEKRTAIYFDRRFFPRLGCSRRLGSSWMQQAPWVIFTAIHNNTASRSVRLVKKKSRNRDFLRFFFFQWLSHSCTNNKVFFSFLNLNLWNVNKTSPSSLLIFLWECSYQSCKLLATHPGHLG